MVGAPIDLLEVLAIGYFQPAPRSPHMLAAIRLARIFRRNLHLREGLLHKIYNSALCISSIIFVLFVCMILVPS